MIVLRTQDDSPYYILTARQCEYSLTQLSPSEKINNVHDLGISFKGQRKLRAYS